MTKVEIHYNPLKVCTRFLIDDSPISLNSKLHNFENERIQLWIDKLIPVLIKECNDKKLDIMFKGSELDYEDMKLVCEQYKAISLTHIPIKEIPDRIAELKKIFEYMQQGPIEELKSEAIRGNFDAALNSEFEIAVIATMSSGKSTMINAILGNDIMPSKNEACTATMVRIKNNSKLREFFASSYDTKGKLLTKKEPVDLLRMQELNANPKCSWVSVEGNIGNIKASNLDVVLIDTPGPNNSRDMRHRDATYSLIKNKSMPMILYILNATQLSTNDDESLLDLVAKQISKENKQTSDRFIFAVNKIDNFDPEKGENIEKTLFNVKRYLTEHGIKNPSIYPLSASLAKLIRMKQAGFLLTKADQRALGANMPLFIEEPDMHMDKYSPLSAYSKSKLDSKIKKARESGDELEECLYYSGLPSIELAISEYIEKYAVSTKIGYAIESFIAILNEKEMLFHLQSKLADNEAERKRLCEKIGLVEDILQKGEAAVHFKNRIEEITIADIIDKCDEHKARFNIVSRELCVAFDKKFIKPKMADIINKLEITKSDIITDIEVLQDEAIIKQSKQIMDEYRRYIQVIYEPLNDFSFDGVDIHNIFESNIAGMLAINTKSKKAESSNKPTQPADKYKSPMLFAVPSKKANSREKRQPQKIDVKNTVASTVGSLAATAKENFSNRLKRFEGKSINDRLNIVIDDELNAISRGFSRGREMQKSGVKLVSDGFDALRKKLEQAKNSGSVESAITEYGILLEKSIDETMLQICENYEDMKKAFWKEYDAMQIEIKEKISSLKQMARTEEELKREIEKCRREYEWLIDFQSRLNALIEI